MTTPNGRGISSVRNSARLTVLDLTSHAWPPDVGRRLRDAAAVNPQALVASLSGTTFEYAGVRIGPAGIHDGGPRLGSAEDLLKIVPRADVVQESRYERRGLVWGALGDGAAGVPVAALLAFKQCGDTCTDEKALMGPSLIGIPIGASVLGYHTVSTTRDTIGHRAAPGSGRSDPA